MIINLLGTDFDINVTYYLPYTPAKIHGLPEDCTPEEGPEVEFEINDADEFAEYVLENCEAIYSTLREQVLDYMADPTNQE